MGTFKSKNFNIPVILCVTDNNSIIIDNVLTGVPRDFTKSIPVLEQVMAWCHQETYRIMYVTSYSSDELFRRSRKGSFRNSGNKHKKQHSSER